MSSGGNHIPTVAYSLQLSKGISMNLEYWQDEGMVPGSAAAHVQ